MGEVRGRTVTSDEVDGPQWVKWELGLHPDQAWRTKEGSTPAPQLSKRTSDHQTTEVVEAGGRGGGGEEEGRNSSVGRVLGSLSWLMQRRGF